MVPEIAETDAHVVQRRCRNRDRDRNAEDRVRHGQRPQIARLEKDEARGEAPHEREYRKNRIGKMRGCEDDGCCNRRQSRTGQDAEKTGQKIALQKELLRQRPDGITAEGEHPLRESTGAMQRVHAACQLYRTRGKRQSHAHHPGRTPESGHTAAESLPPWERKNDREDKPGESSPVEPALQGARRPDDSKDQCVADREFTEVPECAAFRCRTDSGRTGNKGFFDCAHLCEPFDRIAFIHQ